MYIQWHRIPTPKGLPREMVRKDLTKARSELTRETLTPLAPRPVSGTSVSKGLGGLVPPAVPSATHYFFSWHGSMPSLVDVLGLWNLQHLHCNPDSPS